MNYVFLGLPLHILLVHFVVVLGPLTCLAVLLHAFWPAARRRFGIVTPILGIVVAVLVPITTSAGEALEPHVTITPAVANHVALGETLTPWAEWLLVVSLALWGAYRFVLAGPLAARVTAPLRLGAIVVLDAATLAVATGFLVDVIRIGDAGARAVWGGVMG